MQVSADIRTDYLYRPKYTELSAFRRVFSDPKTKESYVRELAYGWTLKAYDHVPTSIPKGTGYIGGETKKTRSFDTKQEFLTFIRHGLNPCDGSRLPASQGLILNKSMTVNFNQLGSITNHVPVLFSLVPTKCNPRTIITAFEGIYDFRTRLFHGQLQLTDWAELWKD